MLAIPSYEGKLYLQVVNKLLYMKPPKGYKFEYVLLPRMMIARARTGLAQYSLDRKCEYLCFIDDDQVVPTNAIQELVKIDKDIVGSPIPSRRGEKWIAVFDEKGDKLAKFKGTKKVGSIGMGCTLIKTKVFKKMFKKWKSLFDFEVIQNEEGIFVEYSEDITFCNRARELGFETWCTDKITVTHLGDPVYYWYENGKYHNNME